MGSARVAGVAGFGVMENPLAPANEGTGPPPTTWMRLPLSVRAEKKAPAFGRSPGSWIANARWRFAAALSFPDRWVEWICEGGLHLQWRDRAGIGPASLLMP